MRWAAQATRSGGSFVYSASGISGFGPVRPGAGADWLPFLFLAGAWKATTRGGRTTFAAQAGVAQLVEHQLPKLRVAGSNPVSRSGPHRDRVGPFRLL